MEYMEDCKKNIDFLLEDQRVGPELRIQDFDDYVCLINGEVTYDFRSHCALIFYLGTC